jgi:hypothetical protein
MDARTVGAEKATLRAEIPLSSARCKDAHPVLISIFALFGEISPLNRF